MTFNVQIMKFCYFIFQEMCDEMIFAKKFITNLFFNYSDKEVKQIKYKNVKYDDFINHFTPIFTNHIIQNNYGDSVFNKNEEDEIYKIDQNHIWNLYYKKDDKFYIINILSLYNIEIFYSYKDSNQSLMKKKILEKFDKKIINNTQDIHPKNIIFDLLSSIKKKFFISEGIRVVKWINNIKYITIDDLYIYENLIGIYEKGGYSFLFKTQNKKKMIELWNFGFVPHDIDSDPIFLYLFNGKIQDAEFFLQHTNYDITKTNYDVINLIFNSCPNKYRDSIWDFFEKYKCDVSCVLHIINHNNIFHDDMLMRWIKELIKKKNNNDIDKGIVILSNYDLSPLSFDQKERLIQYIITKYSK